MSSTATTTAASTTNRTATRVEGTDATRSLRSSSRLLLIAVGAVVVFVTLPLLRGLALKENERDALRVLELVGSEVFAAEVAAPGFDELLESRSELARRLPDTRLLAEGRLMFHHGYLFEIFRQPDGGHELRAWPLRHGETGLGAFWSPGPGRVLGHPNRAAAWSGLGGAPELTTESSPASPGNNAGWRPLSLATSGSSGM